MPQTGTCEGSHPPTVTEKVPLYVHLIAGGGAGFIESCTCHPLDTIKVRLQLQTRLKNASTSARVMEVPMQTGQGIQAKIPIQRRTSGTANLGPFSMGLSIVRNEGYLALYKGLGAVVTAIVPKMAIRFTSFEYFKSLFQKSDNHLQPYSQGKIFIGKSPPPPISSMYLLLCL